MPEFARLRSWLERRWYGPGPPLLLRPPAAMYALLVRLRRAAYARGSRASRHPGLPVVVIGNIVAGGTGKTPLAIWLAQAVRAAGQRPGVALRGYGGRVAVPRLVAAGDDPAAVGDEAVLVARRAAVPVAVGADRVAAARLLAGQGCTVVICDDGLQHLALRRDVAIAVIDGARGFGNGALLPAGPLREPVAMLDACDLVVINGEDSTGAAGARPALRMTIEPAPLRCLISGPEEPLERLRGESVHAVAGIGHPQRFFGLLRSLGARPVEHAFPDHHAYRIADLDFGDSRRIVMTEKDAVKCAAFARQRMWYLPVSASLPDADAARLLGAVLAKLPGGGASHA
ncbi:MAG TPA: tetraacyldisaccharide 4'-kinase [Steroidobacteraceae bacterium]|nr:tetraacyldisaccharide 4'-kinase [Steroidobacteraceae bacterium]